MASDTRAVLIAATFLLIPTCAQAATAYRITDLGDLSGGVDYSEAYGINSSGQVVGLSGSGIGSAGGRAFVWTAQGGMHDLDVRGDHITALAINDAGQVVGEGLNGAYLWMPRVGSRNLVPLAGYSALRPADINNAGQVVGFGYHGSSIRAFRWTARSGMQDLGDLGGGEGGRATAINDDGHVVGGSSFPVQGSSPHAFLWTAASGMQDLGTLASSGATYSSAWDINNSGQVVGTSLSEGGEEHAFLWTAARGMQDLGTPPGDTASRALAINDVGEVVGENRATTDIRRALLWTSKDGMQDLNDLIDPLDPLKAATRLLGATDINNAGEIVGNGIINGKKHAFLLTPVPEPASCTLLLAGVALMGMMLRRRTIKHLALRVVTMSG